MNFMVTFSAVAVMLIYAIPGWLLIKTKAVSESQIPAFSKLLVFVCQPCLTVYSFTQTKFSLESLKNMGICFVIVVVLQLGMTFLYFWLFKKNRKDIVWRIVCIASVMSNVGFLGIPLLETLLPENPEVLAYSSIFSISMNIIGWSVGLYIISLDKKYISLKKILVTPATIGLFIALPIYLFSIPIPELMSSSVSVLGRMATPLCMIIMGMRLATAPFKNIFLDKRYYLALALNQFVYPLVALALVSFLPIDEAMKKAIVIMCAAPIASMVQNFSELIGQGARPAANMALLGTLSSIVTVPLVCLLL